MKKHIAVGSLAVAVVVLSSPLLRSQAKPAQAPSPRKATAPTARPPHPAARLGEIILDIDNQTKKCIVTFKTDPVHAFRRDLIVWKIENNCSDSAQHDIELRFTSSSPVDNCDLMQKNVLKNKKRWLACDVPAGLRINPITPFTQFLYTVYVDGAAQADPEVDIWR